MRSINYSGNSSEGRMSWRSWRCQSRNLKPATVIQVKAFGLNHAELHMRKVRYFCWIL